MQCVVPSCQYESSSTSCQDFTFFMFPTEPVLRAAWCDALQKKNWTPKEGSVVCSKHFLREDLLVTSSGQYKLCAGAVPVVNVKVETKFDPLTKPYCDVQVCRICFATDIKLYPMTAHKDLYEAYETVTGLLIANEDKLPIYLCTECAHRLQKCVHFRSRSLQAHLILLEIIRKNQCITLESIQSMNRLKGQHSSTQIPILELNMNSNMKLLELQYDVDVEFIKDVEFINKEIGYTNGKADLRHSSEPQEGIKVEKSDVINAVFNNEVTINDNRELHTVCDSILQEDTGGNGLKTENYRMNQDNLGSTDDGNEDLDKIVGTSNTTGLQEVLKTRRKLKPYSCYICKAKYSTKNSLQKHLAIHSGKKPYSCNVCKKTFIHKGDLHSHIKVHTSGKPFSCDVCKKTFRGQKTLKKHLSIHSGEILLYSCGTCKKEFRNKAYLKRHCRLHTGEKPFSCEVCKKHFNTKSILGRHLKLHSGEKLYSCTICGKRFCDKSNLKSHLQIHSDDKTFSCNVCKKQFNRNSGLKSHLRIHSDDKPYSCEVCQKCFRHKFTLQCHMKLHSDEKLFLCNICKECFRDNSTLRKHLLIHSGAKPYSCVVCDKSFNQSSALNRHLRTHK